MKEVFNHMNRAERDSQQVARRAAPEGAGKGMLHFRPHLRFRPLHPSESLFLFAFRQDA